MNLSLRLGLLALCVGVSVRVGQEPIKHGQPPTLTISGVGQRGRRNPSDSFAATPLMFFTISDLSADVDRALSPLSFPFFNFQTM